MSAQIILCPRGLLYATATSLQARGLAISIVRGKRRALVIAHRPPPVLTDVFRLGKAKEQSR